MDNSRGSIWKRTERLPESTTASGPRPWDFPLGSLESRAAARALFWRKPELAIRVEHVGRCRPAGVPTSKKIPGTDVVVEHVYADDPQDKG